MQRKRDGQGKLDARLQPRRHALDEFDQVGAIDGGEDGVEEKGHGSRVQEAGEGRPGDPVQGGEHPGQLRDERAKASQI